MSVAPETDPYADVPMLESPQWLASGLIGPYTAGYSAQLVLFGLFSAQFLAFVSSGEFSRLPRRLSKVVLLALYGLNLAYTGVVWWEQYRTGFRVLHQDRDLVSILELDYVFNIIPLLGGLVAALTQCYLTFRAGNFISNHRARYVFYGWMGLLVALALAGAGLVTGLGFLLNIRGGTTVLPLSWNSAACIWLSATATTDLSISLALAYSLRKRIKNFNGTTDSLLKQLIYLALRTAAYTAILSIAGLIVAAVYKDSDYGTTNIHIALWLPLPALYGSSVFTTITASRRAIAYSIGGVSTYPGPVASTGMTGINPLQSGRHSLTAVPPHLKRDSRRFSAFNGVVSGVPMRSPTPPAPAANRNSGKFSIKVVTEVERKEEREAYEEIRLTLGKRDSVARWLQKRDGEDEGDDEDEVLVDKEEKVDSLV
ncbi:hypothetical protein JCM8097_000510 [Rhodosporidiobolus ruineniae]